MKRAAALALLTLLHAAGCRAVYTARLPVTKPLITQGDTERPYRVLGHLSVHQTGWYFFSFLPIVSVDLQELIERALPDAAARMGADAVLFTRYEMKPASIFRFSIFPIPDWTAEAMATGMAVAFVPAEGKGAQPPAALPPLAPARTSPASSSPAR